MRYLDQRFSKGLACGFCIAKRRGEVAILDLIAVDPALQGKGLGRALIMDFHALSRAWSVSEAQVCTQSHNAAAVHVYQRCGFALTRTEVAVDVG